jgi:hypothetical protein
MLTTFTLRSVAIVLCLISCASSAGAQQSATVTTAAPIFLVPDGNREPLRVAKEGTVLIVLQATGDWLQVEFKDPQFGTRTGYIQARFVNHPARLQPTDLSTSTRPVKTAERISESIPEERLSSDPPGGTVLPSQRVAPTGDTYVRAQQQLTLVEYRVMATNKTSTMQKEMQEAAAAGYHFGGVMGGDTSFGGSEVVVIMSKDSIGGKYDYRLLATNKTSTMQKEMQEAGDAGFEYRGQTVFKTTFGGKEVVAILERSIDAPAPPRYEYRLLATKKTSTMQKELAETGEQGFNFVGLTVAHTLVGGNEVVAILRRKVQ